MPLLEGREPVAGRVFRKPGQRGSSAVLCSCQLVAILDCCGALQRDGDSLLLRATSRGTKRSLELAQREETDRRPAHAADLAERTGVHHVGSGCADAARCAGKADIREAAQRVRVG
jgi:hypothetical protein